MATSATVFVTLAATGGSPASNSAGYDTSDASPTTVLSTPATTPAPESNRKCSITDKSAAPQNLIGVLLLVPLVVGVLALVQERSSGIKVPWRD